MKTAEQKRAASETRAATERFRVQHHRAIETLRAPNCERSGLELWRKCVQLESLAHGAATASCNGEPCRVVWPLFGPRDYDFNRDENAWDNLRSVVTDCIRNIFGHVPPGFIVNGDPRGYALKIDGDSGKVPAGMHTDWGRNGILAAEINDPE
jgi:hypothetical protein